MSKLNDPDITLSTIKEPLNLQKMVLDDISDRFTGGQVIVDPNQTSMLLLEMSNTATAGFARACENSLSSWLAKRANTSEDLYKHMSDYDYVGLFANPSTTSIALVLDRNYLINKALNYNDNYKLVVVPERTVFKLGTLEFGIYYPINIRINRHTGYITAIWDTTKENNLYTLNTNVLQVGSFEYLGIEYTRIIIPIHQFTRTIVEDSVVPGTGFAKKYTYNDKFYAARFFTNQVGTTELLELHQALGRETYDSTKPTVRMQVLLESNTLSANIPQIYVTDNKIGSKIIAEIYTTKGDITPNIAGLDGSQLKINFNIAQSSSMYSKILTSMPVQFIEILADNTTSNGGSNGLTFEELRSRVVNSSFHTTALITPIDLENFFSEKNFTVVKYKDNLTNLIYFAYKVLKDSEGTVIPAANIDIELTEDSYKGCSSIHRNADGSLTILPSTLYRYDENSLSCIPLTDTERNYIARLSKEEQVALFNQNQYTKSPFHIRLRTENRYPFVSSYNLNDPVCTNVKFTYENDSITAQMTIASATIIPLGDGSEGFRVTLLCQQSQDLYTVREEDIIVYFYTLDKDDVYIGKKATSSQFSKGLCYYTIDIPSTYHFTKDHYVDIGLTSGSDEYTHYVQLEQKYYVGFLVNSDYFPDAINDQSQFVGIPNEYSKNYTYMIRQEMDIKLGYALDDVVYNSINLQWSSENYLTYQSDVALTYTTDVYETDDSGVPKYSIVDGKVIFTKIHSEGDLVYDESGNQIYKYRKGDKILDAYGNSTVVSDRVLKYYIQACMIDAKHYISDYATSREFRNNLSKTLESYFSVIRTATRNLLERDKIYFKPLRTMGYGEFDIGEGVTTMMPLELTMRFKLYVDNEAYVSSELKSSIRSRVISIVEDVLTSDRISMTDIANICKENIDHVEAVDVLGINGDIDLQTLIVADESIQPSIKQEVYLTQDNLINIQKAITLEFAQMTYL